MLEFGGKIVDEQHSEQVAQLYAATEPGERGRLLDLDFERLTSASRRFSVGIFVVAAVVATTVLYPVVSALAPYVVLGAWDPRQLVVSVAIGGVLIHLITTVASKLVRGVVLRLPPRLVFSRRLYTAAVLRVVVVCVLVFLMGWVSQPAALGMIAGAGLAALSETADERNLPRTLVTDPHTALHVVEVLRRFAAQESVLGYRVRWMLVEAASSSILLASATALLRDSAWSLIPAVAVLSLASVLPLALSLRGRWWQALIVRGALSIGFAVWVTLTHAPTSAPILGVTV
jgi:hypothetical protein